MYLRLVLASILAVTSSFHFPYPFHARSSLAIASANDHPSSPSTSPSSQSNGSSSQSTSSSSSQPSELNPQRKYEKKISAPRPRLGASVGTKYVLPHTYTKGGSLYYKGKFRPQGEIIDRPTIGNPSRLRVLGGSKKGLPLTSPDVYLRPMMSTVKLALFSTLISIGIYSQPDQRIRHLDVFAGSGSVGIEVSE